MCLKEGTEAYKKRRQKLSIWPNEQSPEESFFFGKVVEGGKKC